jgi:hypothetical protein
MVQGHTFAQHQRALAGVTYRDLGSIDYTRAPLMGSTEDSVCLQEKL